MEVAGLLGSWGRWWHKVHGEAGGHKPRNMALLGVFSSLWQLALRMPLWLVSPSPLLSLFRHLEGSTNWDPSLLFGMSGF